MVSPRAGTAGEDSAPSAPFHVPLCTETRSALGHRVKTHRIGIFLDKHLWNGRARCRGLAGVGMAASRRVPQRHVTPPPSRGTSDAGSRVQ